METLGDNLVTKTSNKTSIYFNCKYCDYTCCKKYNLDRHLLSSKHTKTTVSKQNEEQNEQNEEPPHTNKNKLNTTKFICKTCNKKYDSRNGLWKHKKTCKMKDYSYSEGENTVISNTNNSNEIQELKEFMKYLMKENSEMKNMMIGQQNIVLEIAKNGTTSNSHNNNTNSHNKAFNLQLFLNETCKDAMNINDFVESIQLQLSDFESLGDVGYVEGISNIILKNLNALDVTQRPIHCTDKKRETIYIKDENSWEKDESQCKMRKMIKKVVSKNQRLIPKFKQQYPDYNKSYSKVSDKYNKLIIESMGGSGNNDAEKEDKIVRTIAKNVTVDKETEVL